MINRLYYRFKPFIPWRLRMRARQLLAQRQRQKHSQTWPINEAAGRTPGGWPGWHRRMAWAAILPVILATSQPEGRSGPRRVRATTTAA